MCSSVWIIVYAASVLIWLLLRERMIMKSWWNLRCSLPLGEILAHSATSFCLPSVFSPFFPSLFLSQENNAIFFMLFVLRSHQIPEMWGLPLPVEEHFFHVLHLKMASQNKGRRGAMHGLWYFYKGVLVQRGGGHTRETGWSHWRFNGGHDMEISRVRLESTAMFHGDRAVADYNSTQGVDRVDPVAGLVVLLVAWQLMCIFFFFFSTII